MQNKKLTGKAIILVAAAVFVVLGAGVALALHYRQGNSAQAAAKAHAAALKKVEKQDVNDNKAAIAAQQSSTPSKTNSDGAGNSNTATGISVVITSAQEVASSVQVSSYVSGVFEDGGTCTLTLKKDSQVVTRTAQGLADASHTTCPTFTIDNNGHAVLGAGMWAATVSYSSAAHPSVATSQIQAFKVQ